MPNKKKQRNAFYFFMLDMREDMARRGQHVKMEKMSAIAHPEWKKLSDSKQEEYKERAKQYKEDWKLTEDGKMDCFGVPLTETQKKMKEEQLKESRMIENIHKSLAKHATQYDVCPLKFYFLHFNYACKTDSKMYIPNEVAVVEYSIMNGIENELHEFIAPADIPKGYKFTCTNETAECHGIPHEDFERANGDYEQIYADLKRFVKSEKKDPKRVYAFPADVEQVEKCFEWLRAKSGAEDEEGDRPFQVYNVLHLFERMREICGHPVLTATAEEFFSKTTYNYEANIGCKFHDQIDKMSNCSLSIVKRIAYHLSDHLISPDMYDVELIGGQHLPEVNDDNFMKMDPKAFKMSGPSKDYMKEPAQPEPKYSMPVLRTVGKSAVFGPDSADIYGASYAQKEKMSDANAAPVPKRALRTQPPAKYNEATIGWAPQQANPQFTVDENEFPTLGDVQPAQSGGFGRGNRKPTAGVRGNVFAKFGSAGFGRGVKKN